jgi:hypothetical protein
MVLLIVIVVSVHFTNKSKPSENFRLDTYKS